MLPPNFVRVAPRLRRQRDACIRICDRKLCQESSRHIDDAFLALLCADRLGAHLVFVVLAIEHHRSRVAADTDNVHTPTMTLKNAALLALIGTIVATVLLVWTFTFNFINVLRGLAPPVMLFPWFIYAFACFSVAVFFYVFYKAQP